MVSVDVSRDLIFPGYHPTGFGSRTPAYGPADSTGSPNPSCC